MVFFYLPNMVFYYLQNSYHLHPSLIFLINSHFSKYSNASYLNHVENRPRKLLLHKKEIRKIIGKLNKESLTLIPTKIYFNKKGKAKLEIALAKGKKLHDKRDAKKRKDWVREKKKYG